MERINRILNSKRYQSCLEEIHRCEEERIFCGHDMGHFLDVARLAYVINLEEKIGVTKERVYAAALLHDIGRHFQYLEGIPHEQASEKIAREILTECGFPKEDIQEICLAIANHRNPLIKEERSLSGLIYRGDKLSRSCFGCRAEDQCSWDKEKKNLELIL